MKILVWLFILIMCRGEEKKRKKKKKKSLTFLTLNGSSLTLWNLLGLGHDISNARGLGVGIVLVSLEGIKLEKSLRLGFRASKNEAKYEALIARLQATKKLRVEEVEMFSNSRLVVSQIDGSFKARDHHMSYYLKLFGDLRSNLQKVSVVRMLRSQNCHADSLVTLASSLHDYIP